MARFRRTAQGLLVASAGNAQSDMEIAILRTMGRLEFMLLDQVHRLFFPTSHRNTALRFLEKLAKQGNIWVDRFGGQIEKSKGSSADQPASKKKTSTNEMGEGATMLVYGLTPQGQDYIIYHGYEQDERALPRYRTRPAKAPDLPLTTLLHDLQASWWCTSVIMEARKNAFVSAVSAQVEYVTHARQRIDAVVGLCIDPKRRPRAISEPIPWDDGLPLEEGERWYWFGLEVDRGKEALKLLLGKAVTYRDLTLSKVYDQLFPGVFTPVFLVPEFPRAAQIAREWEVGFPQSTAVISTPQDADDPERGVLWGRYRRLIGGERTTLLTAIPREQWKLGEIKADQKA